MYFPGQIKVGSAYTQAIDFLAAQNPKEVGVAVRNSRHYPIWALLKERLNTLPRLEYVAVTNASGKIRISNTPPFIITHLEPTLPLRTRIINSTLYYPVHHKSREIAILRRLWATRSASSEKGSRRKFQRTTSAGFEPLIRSPLDVYLDRKQNSLVYVRDRCSPPAASLRGEIPVVGHPFRAVLSRWVREKGMSIQKPWQWERGNDTEGWVKIPILTGRRWRSEYTPTPVDVGYSLRASVEYTDNDGNQVRVTTGPSRPVARDSVSPPDRPRARPFFFLHIFPVDVVDLPSFDGRREDFLGLSFTREPGFRILLDERCMAVRFPLPPFDIARIRTGESTDEGPLWEAEVSFNE